MLDRLRRPFRSLRFRVPATAMAIFAISLAVASVLAYELLLQDGQRDIDVVIAREQERFELSISELLAEAQQDDPEAAPIDALRRAVERYLALNPSTQSYWTIVTFEDGRRYASANGPLELEPLYREGRLPTGPLNLRSTVDTDAGEIRTSSVPVLLSGEQVATLQVVSPLAPVRAEAIEAAGLLAAAAGIALLLGGILLTATLWRSLTPLGGLAAAARSTELRSLGERVEVPDTEDEVGTLAREFNRMLDRLEQATAAQHEFMASIGHELRTPITIARGHLELLETVGRDDPEALTETVAIVQDEMGRMTRLVEDLMAIARSDMEDFVRPRPLELVSWFEELELRIAATPAGSVTRIEPPPPVTLHADPDRLAQAVLNLVTNAHLHTPEGTRVAVRARLEPDRVAILVADDGPGIPEEIRDEVFAPFVRAGEAPSSTGLGLSVVQAVVAAHDGEVTMSTGERGTAFVLHLPWRPVGPDDGELPADEPVDPEFVPVRGPALEATVEPLPTAQLDRADPAGIAPEDTHPTLPLRRRS
jgi:two-component system, OmpR family, sensor kinase